MTCGSAKMAMGDIIGNCDLCNDLMTEIKRLRDMIDNRNEFIAERGLWKELGQYLSEPPAEDKTHGK